MADEEVIGIFWGYDGPPELGTPPRLYMQVVLGVLDEMGFPLREMGILQAPKGRKAAGRTALKKAAPHLR